MAEEEEKKPDAPEAEEEAPKESEWDSLVDYEDEDDEEFDLEETQPAAKEQPAAQEEEPAQEEAETQAEAEEAPQQEQGEPEPTSQPEAKPQTPSEAETPQAPEDLNAQFQEWFSKSAETLADQVYALDDETREKLDTAPSEVIPQLAGRLHMQILTAAVTQAANMLPQMIQQEQVRTTEVQAAENAFYDAWPALRDHSQEVDRIADAYLRANPKADRDTAIKEIGTIASVRLQVPLPGQEPPAQQQPAPAPVTPTAARGGQAAAAQPPTRSVWEELIADEED